MIKTAISMLVFLNKCDYIICQVLNVRFFFIYLEILESRMINYNYFLYSKLIKIFCFGQSESMD